MFTFYIADSESDQYQGCFRYISAMKPLGGAATPPEPQQTVDSCITWCRETHQMAFAGMKVIRNFCGLQNTSHVILTCEHNVIHANAENYSDIKV